MKKTRVGKITHYYDKAGVAVLELSAALKEGDEIRIEKGEEGFEQTISSMQIEHEKIKTAKKGQAIGLKVKQPVKENSEVFKLSA
ncbi:MAG: hypothetical protein J4224_01210 [Candidatus Diapherotrites archaeon]|uniref:Translation elongation factor-like protein n=1 Tax=Candidatus Iainarchaeum sp. TaxID=3101447 RepID=A0A7J4IV11_9ARCH|nr:MAG: hypothetical protein QT03_C0001G0813 [archaeon GW2011_AR10]MBS3059025.1 hypothetical protein [Candidatus Diapherotrites archaeon]HIH08660.1 hypothetical protein [Candidatus Diapherotrites archaeon]